jgi:hypothetical protein
VREFLGAWLSQSLHSGPNADQEKDLLTDLARQGWCVRDHKLVRGEPLRRAATAPLLGGDLLANLHPAIQSAARSEFQAGVVCGGRRPFLRPSKRSKFGSVKCQVLS